jgi:hypothetical protein
LVVDITNLTDGPGKTPMQVAIYNATLDPGKTLRLPAELVDAKVRSLEKSGVISIGPLPPWYAAAKAKKGRSLSKEEQERRTVQPPVLPILPISQDLPVEEPIEQDEISYKRKRRGE